MDDFEKYLRAQLSPTNPAGRALAEHRVAVIEVAGSIVLEIHPDGFNAEKQTFVVVGSVLGPADEVTLNQLRTTQRETDEEERKARFAEYEAKLERERDTAAAEEAAMKEKEAELARASRPVDLAASLPDGDRSP